MGSLDSLGGLVAAGLAMAGSVRPLGLRVACV